MPRSILVMLLLACWGCSAANNLPAPGEATATEIEYRSGRDMVKGILFLPSRSTPAPALVVVHGDFGLTRWEKEQCQRFARLGYVVLAVDLYRGEVIHDLMEAHIMDRGLPEDQILGDLRGAVDYLADRPETRQDYLGIIGWGSGGGYALDAACHDARLRAAVVCYGRVSVEPASFASLRAAVLGVFAGKDEGIPSETLERFRTAMHAADKRLAGIHIYPECGHGFMNPDNPNEAGNSWSASRADAQTRIDAFLGAELER